MAGLQKNVAKPRGGSPTIDRLYGRIVASAKSAGSYAVPFFRRILRFLALPYCYLYLVNWKECTASRTRVVFDLLYIFFRLKYYPDNYSPCRLWAQDRKSWPLYYGSMYDPYQRRQLRREVQPKEYEVVFSDKEVTQRLCEALDLPVPRLYATVGPEDDFRGAIREAVSESDGAGLVVKPARGIGGRDVYLADGGPEGVVISPGAGSPFPLCEFTVSERVMLQHRVRQHPAMAAIYDGAVNTIRIQTLLTKDHDVVVLGVAARFGRVGARVDNVSTGGIGVGVDKDRGVFMRIGRDFGGREYDRHPETGVEFEGYPVPRWSEVIRLAVIAQRQFPYYRLLGFDIAVTPDGPKIIEINSFPDNVGLEGSRGPILADPEVLREFDRYGLLINRPAKALARRLATESRKQTLERA